MDFFKLSICTASGAETPRLLIVQLFSRPGMLGCQTDASDEVATSRMMYADSCYAVWALFGDALLNEPWQSRQRA